MGLFFHRRSANEACNDEQVQEQGRKRKEDNASLSSLFCKSQDAIISKRCETAEDVLDSRFNRSAAFADTWTRITAGG
jgi:hypothetical protein